MSWNRPTAPQPVILPSSDSHYADTTNDPSPRPALSTMPPPDQRRQSSLVNRIQILSTSIPRAWINPISGAAAGLASGVVTCPLDVIKTKLQAQGGFATRTVGGEYAAASTQIYSGMIGTAKVIWREEGLRGMYRGLGPMLLGYLPTWAVYMTVYENTRDFWFDQCGNWWAARCGSSLTAGACSTILTNPIWVVKTRLMSQSNKGASTAMRAPWHYNSTLDAFRKMYRTEGILSFYAGLTPALLGLTHVAVQFPLYEWFKMKFTGYGMGEHPPDGESNFLGISAATFLSKVCASTATYPHEVLRTRLQTQQRAQTSSDGMLRPVQHRGLISTCKTMLKQEGIGAFYAGIGVNLVRALPAAMTTMLTYEYLQRAIIQLQFHGEQLKAARAEVLLNKDFYHTAAASLEVKSKAPNGVVFNVKGKSAHDGPISGSVGITVTRDRYRIRVNDGRGQLEGKYSDKATGLTLTQTWTTSNSLDTKLELEDNITKGLKTELLTNYLPAKKTYGGRVNILYKQPNVHTRLFTDLTKGPTSLFDVTVGHEGFIVGAEGGYDVSKAAITKYALAAGYSQATYSAAITATNNLSVFSASYYHKVSPEVEAGAKATWDSAAGSNVGLEVATKYKVDHSSFVKGKINDRGIAALAYNVKLGTGSTLGLGASFDTQNLNQASHKVGASFTFEA
ncbi:hypothetical protein DV735_g401, partial [Chaetothyriales sp. CBS 134920]